MDGGWGRVGSLLGTRLPQHLTHIVELLCYFPSWPYPYFAFEAVPAQ
jgi:hypothetical protein